MLYIRKYLQMKNTGDVYLDQSSTEANHMYITCQLFSKCSTVIYFTKTPTRMSCETSENLFQYWNVTNTDILVTLQCNRNMHN